MSFTVLVGVLFISILQSIARADSNSVYLSGVQGRLVATGLTRFRDLHLQVLLDGGEEQKTVFCRSDGTFTIPKLPPGIHILTIVSVDWVFPQIKIDVSSRTDRSVRFSTMDTWKPVKVPVILHGFPVARFEKRHPFNLWNTLKSPYGIMIGLMLLVIIVFPMMKIDPEEYKQMQAALSNGQAPEAISDKPSKPSRRKE